MPPQTLYDISNIDLNRIVYDQEEIRRCIPQRGDMEMLDAIVHAKPEQGEIIGYKDVRDNEFWVEGHIPGRPLFPGVLMVEAGAQLASFYCRKFLDIKGFIGFGGVDNVKFRGQVVPGQRLYIVGLKLWYRHHRICCDVQGLVDGARVFEAQITGVEF
jgi:3-hydroxyacyl-[acyl-carrier-protein] dehydratase